NPAIWIDGEEENNGWVVYSNSDYYEEAKEGQVFFYSTTQFASSAEQLINYVNDETTSKVGLTDNIELEEELAIQKDGFVLDGRGNTITGTGEARTILVKANDVKLEN